MHPDEAVNQMDVSDFEQIVDSEEVKAVSGEDDVVNAIQWFLDQDEVPPIDAKEVAAAMNLHEGSVVEWDGERKQVTELDTRMSTLDRDSMSIKDYGATDPHLAGSSPWGVPLLSLYGDYLNGDAEIL